MVNPFPEGVRETGERLPPATARWRADVAATGDVVIVTGPVANVVNYELAMARGLTTWVRIPLAQTR